MFSLKALPTRLLFYRITAARYGIYHFTTESTQTSGNTAEATSQPPNAVLEETLQLNKKLLEERKDFEDKYKRALAESENVRKRMLRQVEESKLFGIQSFCKDLLEVADILATAIDSAPKDQLKPEVNPHFVQLFEGLQMTEAQLIKVFGKHNLHKISPSVGDRFDPNQHEAVFTVPVSGKDQQPNNIATITKVGYKLQERTLRPAFVGVFVSPS